MIVFPRLIRLFMAISLFSCCLVAQAADTDSDGFADSADPYPTNPNKPKQRYHGPYVFDGGFANVMGAGDVNSDGHADLIMSKAWDNGDSQNHGGAVRVISGKNRKLLYSYSYKTGGYGGVGAVGDVNNDGYDDFATGAFSENHNGLYYRGTIWIYSGKDGSQLYRYWGDDFGDIAYLRSANSLGDINYDGFGDFALASSAGGTGACYGGEGGIVAVINGLTGTPLRIISDACGPEVSNAGDVNADGFPDMVVGESYANGGNGRVRVFSGLNGSTLYTFTTATAWSYLGMSVSGAGDVNADGFADVIAGSEKGYYVYSGQTGAVLYTVAGDLRAVSGAGDVNNDGYADFAAAHYHQTLSGYGMGWARVYSGYNGEVLQTYRGQTASHYFGTGVSNPGDINGDGKDDLIINSLLGNGTGNPNFTSYVITQTMDLDADGYVDPEDKQPLNDALSGVDNDSDGVDDLVDTDDDNDGLSDSVETGTYGSNPLRGDSDADGLPDAWETGHGRNPARADYQVASGGKHSCALSNGKVKCWGDNSNNQRNVPVLSNPRQVAAGRNHTCALHGSGVKCWGANNKGQSTPLTLSAPGYISAGGDFTCAIDGSAVKCWGDNSFNQLNIPSLYNPVQVAAGDNHVCALDASGVHCWGDNADGQLNVPLLDKPASVSSGGKYSCAVDSTGVVCWGTQGSVTGDAAAAVPDTLEMPTQIAAGSQHACVLDAKGVECWGNNQSSQLAVPDLGIDPDGDGVTSESDAFPLLASESSDTDGDGVGDNSDNCLSVANAGQENADGDSAGDACDSFPADPGETLDTDADGIGNSADVDDDNDGVPDAFDAAPLDANPRMPLDAVYSGSSITEDAVVQ